MTGLATLFRTRSGRVSSVQRHFSTSAPRTAAPTPAAPRTALVSGAESAPQTLAQLLAASPAAAYLGSLSAPRHGPDTATTPGRSELVKAEIARLLREKRFDALLATVSRWTSPALRVPWHTVLLPREMAHVLRRLVEYQKHMLFKASSAKMMAHKDAAPHMAHVRRLREQIRAVYANMLLAPGSDAPHLYAKGSGPLAPGAAAALPPRFSLAAADYENLIELELNNAKLDLALRWFQHLDRQHGPAAPRLRTHRLGVLRFQVYGNAQLSLWRVERSPLNDVVVDPRQSSFKHAQKWPDLFRAYAAQQGAAVGAARPVFDSAFVAVMLLLVAYDKNVKQAARLVEANWGLAPDGRLVPGFRRPAPLDPLFPDLDVLTAVVVALLFNQQYVSCMAYINAFQAHYALDVGGPHSRRFWDQIFRWAEIASRFSEARAFQHFVSSTGAPVAAGTADAFPAALDEAKQSAAFDYERFLAFVAGLRRQRHGLLAELWKCFHESSPGFSARPYRTYMHVAAELLQPLVVLTAAECELQGAALCYDILRRLADEAEAHSVAPCSFNAPLARATGERIRSLYAQTLRMLVHAKGQAGHMAEIPYIARKWSLDTVMERDVRLWAQRRENVYLQKMLELELRRLREDEDDGFLDLL
ncbi:hypothetical protein METBIDRAFT_38187 [Metschnikowia bicuspidata var. bicuspidata NRRL YB-4993]|uniref:ATPase expression protein 2, mitochondrial n=1 Tax=Metschnikowia bicuspidata var. bicuspidata NRRL YB-4993 TaxID=869754 RepID=A0A1A0HFJ8_9ASCO|nr:hypothetical protein METBIDRAFT_38187 [Metschnikowia bicuspidata var. bicuspidata NRRL YB-4993]OBA22776.1 hypothetical protein METBIDRAFT_38187 [Metschnikowia bicuspidata var. bicuspidata NRRL YB-4993]